MVGIPTLSQVICKMPGYASGVTLAKHAMHKGVELTHKTQDKALGLVEEYLNKAGYVPFGSYFSSWARFTLGGAQVLGAAVFACFLCYQSKDIVEEDVLKKRNIQVGETLRYAFHGLTNIGRSYIEGISFMESPIKSLLGKIACAFYDRSGVRMNYPYEAISSKTFPVFPIHG